mmetsp:Transcript_22103/g.22407  ORF Transcript_22103/g.22407 Transcript_22103/m.22407 type:complete len:114 (+) Transcript_22103:2315-2656(+)
MLRSNKIVHIALCRRPETEKDLTPHQSSGATHSSASANYSGEEQNDGDENDDDVDSRCGLSGFFCRRIGPYGTGERMKLINQFAEEHPETSIRQITIKLGEITCKEPPGCVLI